MYDAGLRTFNGILSLTSTSPQTTTGGRKCTKTLHVTTYSVHYCLRLSISVCSLLVMLVSPKPSASPNLYSFPDKSWNANCRLTVQIVVRSTLFQTHNWLSVCGVSSWFAGRNKGLARRTHLDCNHSSGTANCEALSNMAVLRTSPDSRMNTTVCGASLPFASQNEESANHT